MRFSSGKIMRINRYAFRAELVHAVDVFKIPNLRLSPTFLSERVVNTWRASGIRGVTFEKV